MVQGRAVPRKNVGESIGSLSLGPSLAGADVTIPSERSVAVLQAREFLVSLAYGHEYRLPRAVRAEAHRLLRHYPSELHIAPLGKAFPEMWGELDDVHERGVQDIGGDTD